MTRIIIKVLLVAGICSKIAWSYHSPVRSSQAGFTSISRRSSLQMVDASLLPTDLSDLHHMSHSMQYALQGFADALAVTADPPPAVCPAFGEPGWGPLCFLNGNPVFKAFDQFQLFVQNSVVSLHDALANMGVNNAYGPSIILFTVLVRVLLFPVTYLQLASSQKTQALQPKIAEIKAKYQDKNIQNQLTAALFQETNVNPLAGCLPALFQIPVFIALYRSFQNLASTQSLDESFLWLPSLEGPVFGERSSDWLLSNWNNFQPSLGWHDTLLYLSIPITLIVAQSVSLKILTPPSDDPAVQRSQQLLKYLPLMIGYFSLSVPAGLGVYWITNNILSTLSTVGVKQYFKANPIQLPDINLEALVGAEFAKEVDPVWGYKSREEMIQEARVNFLPSRPVSIIPEDFN